MKAVALALIRRENRWFLQRRDPANAVLPGLWEFPGGKSESGETPAQTLERELREEVGLDLKSSQPWQVLEENVRLHTFLVEAAGDPHTELAWGWFTAEEILKLPVPELNRTLIDGLRNLGSPRLI